MLVLAVWTLIAYGGMATRAPVTVLTPIWLATLPLLAAGVLLLARRDSPAPAERPVTGTVGGGRREVAVAVAAVVAAAAGAAAGAPWGLVWLCAAVSLGALAFAWRQRFAAAEPPALPERRDHLFALAAGLGLAVASLFIGRDDPDDVFYVGRATATAELNHIPVRDVIFTAEEARRSGGTGLPTDSFSALEGAVGQLLGVHPASIAYYAVPPLFTFLAVWALWRLLRSWVPRNGVLVLCLVLGLVFWIWSAQSVDSEPFTGRLTPGNFFLTRIWQGKVVFVAWLIPTMYAYLTRWLERRDLTTAALIGAAAVAAIGLTSSAAFVVPLVFGAAGLVLLVRRQWAALALVVAAAACPFAVGLAASRRFPLPSFGYVEQPTVEWYYHALFGAGAVAFIATVALLAAPWLARAGSAASITAGIAVVTVVLLGPGVLAAIDEVFGIYAPGALRRALWVAPLPALVGLLAVLPLPALLERVRELRRPTWGRSLLAAAPAAVLAAVLIAFGYPLWLHPREGSYWRGEPAWKVDQAALASARDILARYDGEGPILAELPIMELIPILTVEPKAVNARTLYLLRTREPRRVTRERLLLTRLVLGQSPVPSETAVDEALAGLEVGLVCLPPANTEPLRIVRASGDYGEAFRIPGQVCLERRA